MKILQKLLLILIIGACAFMIMPQNTVKADVDPSTIVDGINSDISDPSNDVGDIQSIIGKVIGFIQWASIVALIIVLVVKGWEYITGTPEMKDEVKKTAVPLLIGAVLVFGATTIAKFVLNTAKMNG